MNGNAWRVFIITPKWYKIKLPIPIILQAWMNGNVKATLNGTVIASAPANTPSFLVEFDFHVGSFLKITEVGVTIIQFNSLDIIQCNGENEDGKYFFKAY